MLDVSTELRSLSPLALATLVLAAAAATILAALGFQYIGGHDPCALCLQQRYAYYAGLPALAAALFLLLQGHTKAAAAILLAVGAGFVINAGLGIYQAGAEWKFWDPPSTCAQGGALPTFDGKSLNLDRVPALCGVASWRFLGLSFAGWNALISAALAVGVCTAGFKALRSPR